MAVAAKVVGFVFGATLPVKTRSGGIFFPMPSRRLHRLVGLRERAASLSDVVCRGEELPVRLGKCPRTPSDGALRSGEFLFLHHAYICRHRLLGARFCLREIAASCGFDLRDRGRFPATQRFDFGVTGALKGHLRRIPLCDSLRQEHADAIHRGDLTRPIAGTSKFPDNGVCVRVASLRNVRA